MKDFFREIKYAYQRVKYGYDDRIQWNFDSYFHQFIKPMKEFCEERLKETIDEKRIEIFSTTLELIQKYEVMEDGDYYKENNQTDEMWAYIGKNLRWYWS